MVKILHIWIVFFICFYPQPGWSQDSNSIVQTVLNENNFNSSVTHWRITSEHISSTSGIHHIYYQQVIEGIPIKATSSSVHISPKGEILSSYISFVRDISAFIRMGTSQSISPRIALESMVEQMGYKITEPVVLSRGSENNKTEIWFSRGGISQREIPVKLVYIINEENDYTLVWEISILELDYLHWWDIQLDAVTGRIINRKDRIQSCSFAPEYSNEMEYDYHANLYDMPSKYTVNRPVSICENCYEVFSSPMANPFDGERIVEIDPADPTASPYGWHDIDGIEGAESNLTEGNNVSVSERGDNIGYQPDGGQLLDFTGYPFDPVYTLENQYEDSALTNVFYWNNLAHDVFYHYGFDEFSGNFQRINYVTGSGSHDDMDARVQARIGCSAFTATGSNGIRPIMVIGLCDDRDGAYDNIVIVHEYGHGIVKRLLGGSGNNGCLGNDEQMTEGWADYFGLFLTMNATDISADKRPIGNFFFGQGPNGNGIRRYPYSTDFSVNPQTYDAIKGASIPHGVGSVWATMIWEMTWALIDVYGFDSNLYNFTGDINQDAGNIMAMAIIMEGLKLMYCDPGFVDARDAILTANREIYGFDNDCIIYDAFARRGLGLYADQGLSSSIEDGIEDYTEYPVTAQLVDVSPVCFLNGLVTGVTGGLPLGGVYSGFGIIDEGNGISFSVDTSITGIGEVELSYEIYDSFCSSASSTSTELSIFLDETRPIIECPDDIVINVVLNDVYLLPDFLIRSIAYDNCSDELTLTQEPVAYTELAAGEHFITLMATDVAGNSAECVFLFKILEVGDPSLDFTTAVFVYPVPSNEELIIFNPTGRRLLLVEIRDINGRLIKAIKLDTIDLHVPISIIELSAGNYFLTIQTKGDIILKRLIKR
ncbi:MAG: M36 family metallopeptidase [Bacteroidetes bacterium]|nr:M36 family metallopeptidase [Bacteroidota bacterium]